MSEIHYSKHDKREMFALKNGRGEFTLLPDKMDLCELINELLLNCLKLIKIEKITKKIHTIDGEKKMVTLGYIVYYEE